MELKVRIYSPWAFTENEFEKRDINHQIYKQLCEKYKVKRIWRSNMSDEEYQKILEEYDFVYSCTPRYLHNEVVIYKSPDLLRSEQALICDEGNLCFGYTVSETGLISINTD